MSVINSLEWFTVKLVIISLCNWWNDVVTFFSKVLSQTLQLFPDTHLTQKCTLMSAFLLVQLSAVEDFLSILQEE